MKTTSSLDEKISTDTIHIFLNYYSFINLEEKYQSTGGSSGAVTLYLWKHIVPDVEELSADADNDGDE